MARITNRMDTQAIQKETELINILLGVDDAYKAPSALMKILYNRSQRESLFKNFLTEAHYDMSYDWFSQVLSE